MASHGLAGQTESRTSVVHADFRIMVVPFSTGMALNRQELRFRPAGLDTFRGGWRSAELQTSVWLGRDMWRFVCGFGLTGFRDKGKVHLLSRFWTWHYYAVSAVTWRRTGTLFFLGQHVFYRENQPKGVRA